MPFQFNSTNIFQCLLLAGLWAGCGDSEINDRQNTVPFLKGLAALSPHAGNARVKDTCPLRDPGESSSDLGVVFTE